MKSFFANIISSFIGVFLASIAIGFLSIFLLVGLVSSIFDGLEEGGAIQKISEPSVLIMRLPYPIQEKTSEDPFDHYDFRTMESRVSLGLDDIIEAVHDAKNDPDITGIYLNLFPINQGWASAEAIRNALKEFRESGKWIMSYNEIYSHQSYYISSVAEEIYLNPEGIMEFQGLNAQHLFLKETMEKLGIEMQVLRGPDNEFKSAIETFVETEMSEQSRLQSETLINEIWSHSLKGISDSREVDANSLNLIADALALQKADDSVKYSLVDALLYHDQVRDKVKSRMNLAKKMEIPAVSIEDYAMLKDSEKKLDRLTNRLNESAIAVIFADGDIMPGENDRGIIGSVTTAQTIRKARENKEVKAIVIRINSPGGSALAADVILREVYLAAQVKPTVVTFGNVAASGGYYIAAAANKIFAEPSTITGSIGVFSILPNMKNFFNNKLGMYFDNVNTNRYSEFGNISKPLNEYEKQVLNGQLENVYATFKQHVAAGRSMSDEQVEKVARGRIWSGKAALENGLVDELGGLNDAIKEAAQMAGVSNYEIIKLPHEDSPFNRILKGADENAKAWLLEIFVGEEFLPLLEQKENLQRLSQTQGVQARMPFELVID